MKKAKPTKGSARVKKFDRGGTIGALAGLGTLAYLLSRDKDKDKTATASDIKPLKETPVQDTDERFKGAFKGDIKDVMPAEPEKSKMYKAEPGEGVAKPQAPIRGSIGKKPLTAATPKTRASDKVGAGYEGLAGVGAGYRGIDPRSPEEKAAATSVPNAERPSKPYPAAEAAARKAKDAASRRAGQGLIPYEEYTGIGSQKHIEGLRIANTLAREEELRKQLAAKNSGMKKGGKVKKYAEGGTTTSTTPQPPQPKKDTMPEWAKNERENKKKDELNKREAAGAEKEVKRNMSTFGFKKGGTVSSASKRADGCAMRGKTKGKMY